MSYHTVAHSSSNGQLEDGVEATNVDVLIDIAVAADCNCAIEMNGFDGERADFDLELVHDISVSKINAVSRLIGMRGVGIYFHVDYLRTGGSGGTHR
eukprot:224134-Ditylum_brightwellii.AAC.1